MPALRKLHFTAVETLQPKRTDRNELYPPARAV
ncbi:hypothetical protein SRABI76_01719 [Microbacterium oxydans]|uniref:Uncharacterized protein n=1 Tax=Microbacterium oxydans TaxID=82380 RepID=A0A0F0L7I3_9MICO|nr:hypothetical protein RS83_01773 [Microbacterium oxydans]CAH0188789.1 hypothetical protein SRABI76_01719 [Microbacterium oxydans]